MLGDFDLAFPRDIHSTPERHLALLSALERVLFGDSPASDSVMQDHLRRLQTLEL